jgi:hypothetical protein
MFHCFLNKMHSFKKSEFYLDRLRPKVRSTIMSACLLIRLSPQWLIETERFIVGTKALTNQNQIEREKSNDLLQE